MKNLLVIGALVLLSVSCEDNKEEVIDLEQIIPKSERNYDDTLKTEQTDTLMSMFDLDLARSLGLEFSGIKPFDEPLFTDRFGVKGTVKLDLLRDENNVRFCSWTFKDSLKTRNAFYNWLDCFGPNCKSLKYLQPGKFQKESMLIFVNDTAIIYLSSSGNLKMEQWQAYFEKRTGVTNWDIVIRQKSMNKAEWLFYGTLNGSDKRQFLPLVKERK
ncbi:MAG: hypothetical protein ACK45H_00715 [Bacteroidota bacterium]